MEKPAERNCLSEAYILLFISNTCQWVDESKKKSEVKYTSLFYKCFVFPFTLLWHMSFCSFTELYPNILLSESGVQAIDP